MADVLIRGIEMPPNVEGCEVIIRIQPNGEVLDAHKIHIGATAIPLPEGYGDLIDRDNVLVDIDYIGTNKFGMLDEDIRAFLKRYKPIIPAEGGTYNG